jgi:hyperosmotically inducible periplasmic protein
MLKRTAIAALVALMSAGSALAQQEPTTLSIYKGVTGEVVSYVRFTVFDDISASVDGGVVTLSGRVTMPYKASDIERRVAKVPGVQQVKNEIQVLPVSLFDDDLRWKIARAIYGNSAFWPYATMVNPPIHIIVEHGHVTLTGVVSDNVERMLARSLASSSGAFSVKDELKTDAEMRAVMARLH